MTATRHFSKLSTVIFFIDCQSAVSNLWVVKSATIPTTAKGVARTHARGGFANSTRSNFGSRNRKNEIGRCVFIKVTRAKRVSYCLATAAEAHLRPPLLINALCERVALAVHI
jgi:hypothetical protein